MPAQGSDLSTRGGVPQTHHAVQARRRQQGTVLIKRCNSPLVLGQNEAILFALPDIPDLHRAAGRGESLAVGTERDSEAPVPLCLALEHLQLPSVFRAEES